MATRSLKIVISDEMADLIHEKVLSGEFASESEVVQEGLRGLAAYDAAVENWLRHDVLPIAMEAKSDPKRMLSADEAWRQLERHMSARDSR